MKITIFVFLFFFISRAYATETKELYSIAFKVKQINNKIQSLDLYSPSCKKDLKKMSEDLLLFEDQYGDRITTKDTQTLLEELFYQRLKIKDYIDTKTLKKKINMECFTALRSLFFSMRNLEDNFIFQSFKSSNRKYEDYQNFKGNDWHFFKNPLYKFNNVNDLKSGDIILSLGQNFSSEAIAKIGKQKSNFSHLSFVYKDKSGTLYTIEAHGESGVVAHPLKVHLSLMDQTSIVLRHIDYNLAHKAAQMIFNKTIKRQQKYKNILYDFSMDYKDSTSLYCSEVIYHGFQLATDNGHDIAPYKTTFHEGLLPFLKKFGLKISKANIKSYKTFSPGDIEWDPSFKIVAEWKNPAGIKPARIRAAILDKIFNWIANHNYKIKNTKFINLAPKVAVFLRKIPYYSFKSKRRKFLLENLFVKNITQKQISLYLMIDFISLILESELLKYKITNKGLPSYSTILEGLEVIRKDDLGRYLKYQALKNKRKLLSRNSRRNKFKINKNKRRLQIINRTIKQNRPKFHRQFYQKK